MQWLSDRLNQFVLPLTSRLVAAVPVRCRDQLSNEAHGRALIEFAHAASASLAARYLHGETLLGRRLCVQISPLQRAAPDPPLQQQPPPQSESSASSRQRSAWGGAAASSPGALANWRRR